MNQTIIQLLEIQFLEMAKTTLFIWTIHDFHKRENYGMMFQGTLKIQVFTNLGLNI